MTRCPFCGARGVKLADCRDVNDVTFQFDYCGRCGKNWPKDLSARVAADGEPPSEDIPIPRDDGRPPRPAHFGVKVAELAERVKRAGRDFKHLQAGDEA